MPKFIKSDAAPEGDLSVQTPFGDVVVGDSPVEVSKDIAAELAGHPYFVETNDQPAAPAKRDKI